MGKTRGSSSVSLFPRHSTNTRVKVKRSKNKKKKKKKGKKKKGKKKKGHALANPTVGWKYTKLTLMHLKV